MKTVFTSLIGLAAVILITSLVTMALVGGEDDAPERISGYEVTARFDNVGHLQEGARVAAGGVQVGQVTDIDYDFTTYEAVVTMVIAHRFNRFPTDTSASILTTGLTGDQYVGLQPGADTRSLTDGDRLDITSSALILEQIIGQFLYNMAQEETAPQGIGPAVSGPGF